MRIYCLNNISKTILSDNAVTDNINDADTIIVRSADMHNMELPENVLAIARAGAGVNNIPFDELAAKGVVVFNTPGANANSVKELVLCSILLSSRDVLGGIDFVKENKDLEDIKTIVEKEKAKYAGKEIYKKKICVIGLGTIGVMVANSCESLGMEVIGYDPYISTLNAIKLSKNVKYVNTLKDAVKGCDYVSIHVPLMENTKKMVNDELLTAMKDGVVLLNFSRDSLVDEVALGTYLENGKVKKYITDFPNPTVLKYENVVAIPHLGASTKEANDNCAFMAIDELKDYFYNGNITNSVNYPSLSAGLKTTNVRVTVNHKNIPGMINKITSVIIEDNNNIENMVNKSKGDYAYTIIDIENNTDNLDKLKADIEAIEGVLKVRVI